MLATRIPKIGRCMAILVDLLAGVGRLVCWVSCGSIII